MPVSRTAGATANLGIGMLFVAFAAVVIGGVSLKGGYGRLSGVFAGVLLLSSIQIAINVMGIAPHYTQMIQGGLCSPLRCSIRSRAPSARSTCNCRYRNSGRRTVAHCAGIATREKTHLAGRLEGKVAVIVGAARGIGAGIAERFVEEGAKVVIGDTEVEAGRATAARLGAGFVTTDVTRQEHATWIVTEALSRHGRLDIAVQNAGIYPWRMIETTPPDEWDKVMAVNLKGTFLLAQAALKPMKAQRSGRMIFTSSITGPRVSSPGHGHYSASKGGINGFIKAASVEFAPYNITVNGVEPGNIMTEGVRQHRSEAFIQSMADMIPLGRLGTPRDVANAFLFLASDDADYITGTTIVVDGGQTVPEGADFKVVPE